MSDRSIQMIHLHPEISQQAEDASASIHVSGTNASPTHSSPITGSPAPCKSKASFSMLNSVPAA